MSTAEAIQGLGGNTFEADADSRQKENASEKSYADIGKERAGRIMDRIRGMKDSISGVFGSIWSKAVEYGKKGGKMAATAGYSVLAAGEMATDAAKYAGNKVDQTIDTVGGVIDSGIDYAGEKITAGKDAVVEGVTGAYTTIVEKGREGLKSITERATQLKQNFDARVEAARARREERLRQTEIAKLLKEYTDAHDEVNNARRRMYAAAKALNVQGIAMPA